jgi:pyridoxine/pyridoxamine 5'-phosphate oxidase
MHQRLTELLKAADPKVAAVATATDTGRPAAAVCRFAVRDDGVIIVATHRSTHKWQNLQVNPEVALTVGQDMQHPHLQVGGDVALLEGTSAEAVADFYFGVHPDAKAYLQDDDGGFVVITPTWCRITEFTPDGPPAVEEGPIQA